MFLLTTFNMFILIILIAYVFYRLLKTKSIITLVSFTLQLSALTIVILSLVNQVITSNSIEMFYLLCGIVIPCLLLAYDFRSMIKKVKEKGSFEGFISIDRHEYDKNDNTTEVMNVITNETFVNDTISELGFIKDDLFKGIRKKLIQAEHLYNEGNYDDAYELYANLISLFGSSAYLYFNYANISFKKGMYSEAQSYYRKVLELNEQLIGNMKKASHNSANAEVIKNILFKQYLVYYNIGVTYLNMGKLEFALDSFEKTLEINPDFNIAKEGIGRIFTEKGNKHEAAKYYEEILAKDGNNYVISLLLGNLFMELEQTSQAEECFKKCIKLLPDKPEGYLELGKLLMLNMNYSEAVKVYKTYNGINEEDFEAHFNLAGCYFKIHDLDKAVAEYDKALKLNPQSHNCLFNLSLVYEEMEEYDKAIELYKNALLIKIDFVDAYNNLGIVFSKQQRQMEALATYTNGIKACTDNYRLYYNMGVVLFDLRRYDDAADVFNRALEKNSEDTDIYYYLGASLTEAKKYDQAIKAYSKALNQNLSEAEIYYNIAAVYAMMNKHDIAMDNLKKAISINPEIKKEVYLNNVFDAIQGQLYLAEG
ncbi:MAG: Tfp pilus assembly protein PilF [Eubacterium sp.]|nr:Tfp pilus assembly protein PilF [Eubacterium sp.]